MATPKSTKTSTTRAEEMATLKRVRTMRAYVEQTKWMEERGYTIEGYIAFYGTPSAPDFGRFPDGWFGEGGEAIYHADVEELERVMLAAVRAGNDLGGNTAPEFAHVATPEPVVPTLYADVETVNNALGFYYASQRNALASALVRAARALAEEHSAEYEHDTPHRDILEMSETITDLAEKIADVVTKHAKLRGVLE